MGIFEKIFGSKGKSDDIASLSPTVEMMGEDKFWQLVNRSLKAGDDQDAQEQFLIAELTKLALKDIIGFRLRTDYLLYQSYNSALWCAGYIMNGGCSDDGFEYFRCWLISRGKNTYYNAKANPDSLVSEDGEQGEFDFEGFWYIALEAFQRRTGKDLHDYVDYDNFRTREGCYPQFEFTWEEDDRESMERICPKLYAKYNP